MPDQSHLDQRYFIDSYKYNCPFCNRRHVSYLLAGRFQFNWNEKKSCYVYLVECSSCQRVSMHLSFEMLEAGFVGNSKGTAYYRFSLDDDFDEKFFYSVPTSFFVLDNRIPRVLRELISEAEGSLKSNFLTGASACARKVVYELGVLQKAAGGNYEDRIKSLKSINPQVDPAFFDTLLTIQQVTSTKVHEESYDGWEAKHLRLILSSLAEVLREIYVVPAEREDKRKAILKLKDEVLMGRAKPDQNQSGTEVEKQGD